MVVVIVIGEGGRGEKKGFDGRDRMDKRVKEGEGGGWRDGEEGGETRTGANLIHASL